MQTVLEKLPASIKEKVMSQLNFWPFRYEERYIYLKMDGLTEVWQVRITNTYKIYSSNNLPGLI